MANFVKGVRYQCVMDDGNLHEFEICSAQDNGCEGNTVKNIVVEDKGVVGQWRTWKPVIAVKCTAGLLRAEISTDDKRWPEIYVSLVNKNGTDIDICTVAGDAIVPEGIDKEDFGGQDCCEDGVTIFRYLNPTTDEYTDAMTIPGSDIEDIND